MSLPTIVCSTPVPRPASQGLDSIEVSQDQRSLTITFIANVAAFAYLFETKSYTLSGGRRLHPRVLTVTSAVRPDQLVLHLDQPGDFSIYTLTLSGKDIDPFFAARKFSFKIECEDPFDCKPLPAPPVPEPASPDIDYLTKDYAGFRQLLLDQLPARLPDWTERSEADIGIALVELFSEAADRLSYYQDRVANEAYLDTATQRRSVQLHTALIGYRMRPGCAAQAYLFFETAADTLIPAGTQVQTETQGSEPAVIFETGPDDFLVHQKYNLLTAYTWDNNPCCIPAGATEVILLGDYSEFHVGDAILIADASDPDRREVVQLTADPEIILPDKIKADPLQRLTRLQWSEAQALKKEYCLQEAGTILRGNLVPATHGETVIEENLGSGDESLKRLALALSRAPLTYLAPAADGSPSTGVPTSTLQVQVDGQLWEERDSLIESGPFDPHYRVELDDEGFATLVFSDGVRGQKPPTGSQISAVYRIGIGPAGNVGRDTLTELVPSPEGLNPLADSILSVTNPLPAQGGVAPEDKNYARRVAPLLIETPIRCVTEADYEKAATDFRENGLARIQRAKARFVWTGSWLTVFISVDPIGSEGLTETLRAELSTYIKSRKLAGYDLEITATNYVPLDIRLSICVRHGYSAGSVRAALLLALSDQVNPDGQAGFFNPDNFTFGQPVILSRLYAAIEAVAGVDSVIVNRFCRLHQRDPQTATSDNLAKGRLLIGEMEIARLDNDPSFPENGQLQLDMLGG